MSHLYRSEVAGVGRFVPEKIVTNDDLAKLMDTSDEWIRERTGIRQRRLAELGESTSGLGAKAAMAALKNAGWQAQDVDLILAATLSPDYYFPGIGVLIQKKIGAPTVPALDIRGQCSGFAWSIATADAFIKSGQYKKVLIVGAEIHSRIIEFSNRGRDVSVLFGDGAGALCLEAKNCDVDVPRANNDVNGVIDSYMGSDGSGAELLYVARPGLGGEEQFLTVEEASEKAWRPKMEGRQVFKHAVSRMLEACDALLTRNGLSPKDIDLLVPHQANIRINEMVAAKLSLKEEQVFNNIHKYGNTTAATLPLLMSEAQEEGRLKKGDLILTVAFGSGFTWAANLIRW